MTDEATNTWRSRLWRWRRLSTALILLLAFRVMLPDIVRTVIAWQASNAMRANVTIGDVDLELYRGGVALEDVEVRAREDHPIVSKEGTVGRSPAASAGSVSAPVAPTATPAPAPNGAPATSAPQGDATPESEGGPSVATPTPALGTPPSIAEAQPSARPPLIAWKRLAVAVTWLPLFRKTIELRELILESPRVDLQRLESGDINLLALVPLSAPAEAASPLAAGSTPQATETPTPPLSPAAQGTAPANGTPAPPAETASGWQFGIDRFVLLDGRLHFLDRMMKGSEPVDLGIDGIELEDIALGPGVYEDASRSRITMRVDEGTLTIGARARLTDTGMNLETEVQAQRLPLRRSRLYVPKVGWSDLKGEVDADLKYQLETGTRNELRGTVTVRDVLVRVPQLPEAALSWKRFSVTVDPVDLMAQQASVSAVELAGLVLTVELQGGARLPLLDQSAPEPPPAATVTGASTPTPEALAAAEPKPAAETMPGEAAPAAPGAPAKAAAKKSEGKPWHWTVSSVRINESDAHLLTADQPLHVAIELAAKDLADSADASGHVNLQLAIGDGSLNLDGDVRVQPPAFGGKLKLTALPIPELIKASGAVPQSPLESAKLDTDLEIEAGLPAGGDASASSTDVRVRGTVGLNDLRIAMPDPQQLTTTARAIDITIGDLSLPGVLALAGGGTPPSEGASSNDVHLQGKIVLSEPNVALAGAQPLSTTARRIDVTIANLMVPGVLPGGGGAAPAATPGASAVRLQGEIVLNEPRVALGDRQPLTTTARAIDLTIGDLSLPGLVSTAAPAPAGQTGASAPNAVQLKGNLALAEPLVALDDGKDFSVGAKAITLGIADIAVPGVFGPPPPPDIALPLRVALGELRLEAPAVKVTRTAGGIVLPGSSPPAPEGAPKPAEREEAPPPNEAATAATSAPPPPATSAQPLDVKVDAFQLSKGRVQINDRSLTPPFSGVLSPIDMRARDIRYPALQVKQLLLSVTTPTQGTIVVKGDLTPQGGALDIDCKDVSLLPYNPYASHYSSYRIGTGALSLTTKATFGGGKYDTTSSLTLHQFDLRGGAGDSLFQEQFGVPITMALALMRDTQGDIAFDIPVQIAPEGTQIDIVGIVGQALRRAIVNALASPLKLLGAFTGGDKVAAVAPTIGFRRGRSDFTDSGGENADRVATFLKSRPGMAVAIATSATAEDARWLREQALLKEWQGAGFFGKVRALTQGDTREHVEEALAARAKDEPGELSPEDTEALQKWLDERPPIPNEQLQALATARLEKTAATLQDQGIDSARIVRGEVSPEVAEGEPEVTIQLQPVQTAEAQ